MEDNKKTYRKKLKYGGSYAPCQTFAATVLQLLNFLYLHFYKHRRKEYKYTYSKQKASTMANTIVENTNTQIQSSEEEQLLNDPLAFCEQRPAGESICLKPAGDEYSTRPKFYIAVQILQKFNVCQNFKQILKEMTH